MENSVIRKLAQVNWFLMTCHVSLEASQPILKCLYILHLAWGFRECCIDIFPTSHYVSLI